MTSRVPLLTESSPGGKRPVSKDIAKILDGWDYEPDEVSVRIIRGEDGREKVQLRIDLGLLQMEIDGRPDGQRPRGAESWLDYFEQQRKQHDATQPDGRPFSLDASDCALLLREGVQFYHRYLSFWHLGRYELCARDTSRNLRLFAFVREYARRERDKLQFDQWRPYVTLMHARAVATPLEELEDYEAAIKAVDAGIAGIERFLEEYEQTHRAEECAELVQLRRWRKSLEGKENASLRKAPEGSLKHLRFLLEAAVAEERFEEAAHLRDEIRRLAGSAHSASGETESD